MSIRDENKDKITKKFEGSAERPISGQKIVTPPVPPVQPAPEDTKEEILSTPDTIDVEQQKIGDELGHTQGELGKVQKEGDEVVIKP